MDKIFGIIALTIVASRVKNPKSFLWDTLIGTEKTEKTQRFEVHTKDEGRLRAPLVGKREGSVFVEKTAFQVDVYSPAWIKLHTINEAERMLEQQFGQTIYGDSERAWKKQLAEDITKLKNIAFRTKTWMLAELLKTGTCPTADGQEAVKFGEFNKVTLSSTDAFDDDASDPVAWFEQQQIDIQKKTGLVVDTVITTPVVAAAILRHPKIKEYLKETNANFFVVNDKSQQGEDGGRLVAYLPTLGIRIYTYMDWSKSLNDTGDETPVIEEKHLILAKKGGFTCQYGALPLRPKAQEQAKLFVEKEVVRVMRPESTEDDVLQYISAPLVSPNDAQGWVYAQVLK